MFSLVMLILAIVCFLIAALGVNTAKLNTLALGLAFFAASFLPL